ncbi:MAG: hypothetical protein M0Z43_03130 [Acidithiobacillus sp.]|nr:hypothetical protein [Acidithiobacillus sp.]
MYTTPDSTVNTMERPCELPADELPARLALFEEVGLMQREMGHLAAELRYHQASGEPADLDEWIFSLIFLEARMARLAQTLAQPLDAASRGLLPERRRSPLRGLS